MGKVHLNAYANIAGVQVRAVCSDSARALSGDLSEVGGNIAVKTDQFDLSGVHRYGTWEELVADRDIDLIDVCLPTWLHAEATVSALRNGKHVLCEKPMALSAADCDRMLQTAEANKRLLMVGQVLRFWPEYVYLKNFIREREWGEVRSAIFIRQCGVPDWSPWLTDPGRSGGALLDVLVHDIDQALMSFGLPDRVVAKQLGSSDAIMASLIYPSGPEVRIQGGWFAAGTALSMSYQVRTSRAELEWTGSLLTRSDERGHRERIVLEPQDAYQGEISYFANCCAHGRQPELCPPTASANAVKLALLLNESRAAGGAQLKCSV